MNVITSRRTYATNLNAVAALTKALAPMKLVPADVRWLIAVSPEDGRYVPTVLFDNKHPERTLPLVHAGIMVVG